MSDSHVAIAATAQAGGHSDASAPPVSPPTPDHAEVLQVMIDVLSRAMAIDPLQMQAFECVERHVTMVVEQLSQLCSLMESGYTDVDLHRKLAVDAGLNLMDLAYGLRRALRESPFVKRPDAVH